MNVERTALDGLLVLEPRRFEDERGVFLESWNSVAYQRAGIEQAFVQDNVSVSRRGVLRGLHYQNPSAQGKLITVPRGAAFDVAVDLRTDSRTFGRWFGIELSAQNLKQLWLPAGFAHGFVALDDETTMLYKCTAPHAPEHEHSLRWDDPDLAIEWPIRDPVLSSRDAAAPLLRESDGFLFRPGR
jgi:dTDP-4-dehydrorhamnose 3,5-epimerase